MCTMSTTDRAPVRLCTRSARAPHVHLSRVHAKTTQVRSIHQLSDSVHLCTRCNWQYNILPIRSHALSLRFNYSLSLSQVHREEKSQVDVGSVHLSVHLTCTCAPERPDSGARTGGVA